MKLTTRLSLILCVLAMVVLGTTLGVLYFAERRHLLDQAERQQAAALEKLARVCADSIIDGNELARLTYLKTFWASDRDGVAYVALLDEAGRLLMHSEFLDGNLTRYRKEVAAPELLAAMRSGRFIRQSAASDGRALEVISTPVAGARRLGTVAIAYDRRAIDELVARIQRETLLRFRQAILVGMGLSLLFAYLLARQFTKPILELSRGAQAIGKGKLDTRITVERGDELGELAREFNTMGERLAEIDRLKDTFMAQVTHDLRNPLGAIIGYVDMMLLKIQGPLTPQQTHALDVVLRNGTYLAELINNILDVTKLEAGRMEFLCKPVALRDVAVSVVELMQVKADEFKVNLRCANIPEGTSVWCDDQALRRVLLNLVSNSLKFTPSGGAVEIGWGRGQDGFDIVAVRDSGVGIPKDKLHTVFQKFTQIAETKNLVRESKGTGLGLVICKEIVEQHGGRIWLESEPQKGTTFFFSLPPQPAAAKGPAEVSLNAA